MPCSFETETRVRACYDDGLAVERLCRVGDLDEELRVEDDGNEGEPGHCGRHFEVVVVIMVVVMVMVVRRLLRKYS